ncbi:DUF4349 domain-containing protein [Lederbergia sp. NSJ-179]|uniref:DUF4349 domain-containing protein n=1 Tax=Lederbergia sp. NSJ-179 TaxID=2931402 RepID=UPI001FD551DB|nr:DUF4349 domain-containing protein [Lederbergia sp. NSJ-179]MCJ7841997.1 DUF4349 domain-containing protein [Lederbergia sp. NSJ-179]
MKKMFVVSFMIIPLLFAACSSSQSKESSDSAGFSEKDVSNAKTESSSDGVMENSSKNQSVENASEQAETTAATDRMVIHQVQLEVLVQDLDQAQASIEKKVEQYKGYIVESNMYRESETQKAGQLVIRIPDKDFQTFLRETEKEVTEVLDRTISGEDVTEQYVDLEARLQSKRVVEKRLLSFLEDAEKTEDLLKISNDLADVQEAIETITGKVNFLKNQTDYSTITIYMNEDSIQKIAEKPFNTWEKTKKQLAASTNFLLVAGSGLVVFLIGNLPIFILVLLIGLILFYFIRRRKREK